MSASKKTSSGRSRKEREKKERENRRKKIRFNKKNPTPNPFRPTSLFGTASHLLSTITHARPAPAIASASLKSCAVATNRPSREQAAASTTSATTSARRIADKARPTASPSAPSVGLDETAARRLIPAVSTRRNSLEPMPSAADPGGPFTTASTESRVVPATGDTMARVPPAMAFRRLDLPALGLPTMATASGRRALRASLDASVISE